VTAIVTEVKEHPILLSGEMVRAILDGRKTQTRRIIKPQPLKFPTWVKAGKWIDDGFNEPCFHIFSNDGISAEWVVKCPFGKPGDRLWVRETAWIAPRFFGERSDCNATDAEGFGRYIGYDADMSGDSRRCAKEYGVKKTPSIHMPRWASRITLEITGVRVERIQDISEEDALEEGVDEIICPQCGCSGRRSHGDTIRTMCSSEGCGLDFLSAIEGFNKLWESTYPGSWERNDWVWIIDFKKVEA